jgi:hypothetical protein
MFAFGAVAMAYETNTVPRTQLEMLEAHTNVVIVKGVAEIGVVEGTRGAVLVVAKESTDKATKQKALGVGLTLRGRERTQDVALIDYDELDSFVKGLDQLTSPQWSETSMPQFEASYTTRDGLRVTSSANRPATAVEAVVQSSHYVQATVVLTSSQLVQFRNLLDQARGKLDAIVRAP